jgi:hypothetical protein
MRAASIGHLTGVQLPYGIHLIGVRLGLLRTLLMASFLGRFPGLLINCSDQFDFLENCKELAESTVGFVFDVDILS